MPRLEDLPPERVAAAVAKAVVDAVSQGGDTETIVARALSRAKGDLGLGSGGGDPGASVPSRPGEALAAPGSRSGSNGFRPAPLGSGKSVGAHASSGRALLTEADVLEACRSGATELRVALGTIVTALARDAARDAGLRIVEG